MRALVFARALGCAIVAAAAALGALSVSAGTVSLDLEAKLSTLPPDALVPVIVELTSQADVRGVSEGLQHANRHARGQAVVAALRDTADRSQGSVRAQLAQEEAHGNARKVHPFWIFNGLSLSAKESVIRKLAARDDVRVVRFDRSIPAPKPKPSSTTTTSTADPAWNIDRVEAPQTWALGPGFDGTGVVIGSFDTGVDGTHPDLAPRYRGNDAISWYDPYGEHATPYDNNGHGTHTTGTVVGGDLSGFQIGVAPGAKWIAAKGWDDTDNASVSAFHQIFEWFLAPGGDPANAPQVVNNSWSNDTADCDNEFRPDVQAFRAAGILPVFAAGNSGPDPATVPAPGSYAESYAVGSTDFDDNSSFFSSEGPSPCTGAVKPNISAPGEFVLSTWPGGDYQYLDGTSMATPHVTGAAAVLLSIDPSLTVDELEAMLSLGSVDLGDPGPDNAFGDGRLDVFVSAQIALGLEIVRAVATTPTAYEAGTVPGVITVSRFGGDNTNALTLTYTVSGTATPGSRYLTLPGSVTIPAGASSATIAVTPIDDSIYQPDQTVAVTLDPGPGFALSPATAVVTLVNDDLPPDLVISAMSVPAGGGAGLAITVSDTTKNQGAGLAVASTTTYYLSASGVLDASSVALGSRAVASLGAGASDSGSISVTIPAGTATGIYFLLAKADATGVVSEVAETNNMAFRTLSIGPDLLVTSLLAPSTGGAGASITVTDTTKNQGAGAAAASNTLYYLSTNSVIDAADVQLGARAVAALAPGASDTGSATLTLPAATASGTYYLIAKADGDNAIAETQEINNAFLAIITIGPDLVISSFTVPTDSGAGATITLADTTKNQGTGTAAPTTTTYYLSADATLDASDVVLGSRSVEALAAGASSTGSVTLTIPAGTASGTYYVFAKADAMGAVSEVAETNNTASRSLRIGPDLLISAFSAPGSSGAGATISVTDTTKNQGGGAAPATTTRYYFSANNVLDAGDVMLGARAVAALAPGASDTGSATLTIPAGTASGTYYLFVKADADNAVPENNETNNTYFTTITLGADLVISAMSVPAGGGAGLAITVSDTTKNQGAGLAVASTTTYYLSASGVLDASSVALGSRAVASLGAGASDSGSISVTIPAGTATGIYFLLAKADATGVVSEVAETNNMAFRTLSIGPDLLVTSLLAPSTGGAGASITVTDTTKNQGAGAAAASNTLYYLSTNSVIDAADVQLGARAVAALAPGASDTGSATLTLPAATASGTYYLIAKADGDNAIAETQEINNAFLAIITIGPDLVISSFTVPTDSGAGATITLADTTKNQGTGTAAPTTTTYYLSADATLDASDVVLGSRSVEALAAGASSTGSVTLTIPAGTASGTYYVFAKADAMGAVSEVAETNNTASRSLRIGPDLLISAFSAPGSSGAGATISVTDTTKNQGGGAAPATTTRYYFSANNVLDAGDVMLGARAVAALAPGASDTGSATLTIPAGTASGTYYLFVKADADNAVPENNETNNTYFTTITLGADLVISAMSVPAGGGAGLAITVSDTTKNQGAGLAVASTTTYYLSASGVLDASSVALGSRAVASLGAGASDSGSISVTIPAGTATGIYFLLAKADATGVVSEVAETNNMAFRTLSIGPDLLVTSLLAPSTGGAGASITVTDTTKNQGAGAAAASNTLYYLSTNSVIDAADVQLGARAVAALAPGASDTGSATLTLPAATASGTYYLIAKADGDNAIAETQEINNAFLAIITIHVGP